LQIKTGWEQQHPGEQALVARELDLAERDCKLAAKERMFAAKVAKLKNAVGAVGDWNFELDAEADCDSE
jgi:hypothetical protein